VGDKGSCQVTENGKPCVSCDYAVTGPDGKTLAGKTDENGSFILSFDLPGAYGVAVSGDGKIVKELSLKAAAKAPAGQAQTPSAAGGPDYSILVSIVFLAIILVVLGLLYVGSKKGPPKK
jgi:hypothetical protein